jgi:exo-beta-1,3-glucanase (GH17 family)/cellulose synthase/poly-beta-1,6-N-acetylglucosamine synthase-like glycosyltransferase
MNFCGEGQLTMFRLTNWVIGIAVAIISLSLWAYINRPQTLPIWPERVTGFAFSPYQANQDPRAKIYPTLDEIEGDLELLSGKVTAIRTYSVEDKLAEIPRLARQHGINVCLGAYLSYDTERNASEFPLFIKTARENPNVVRAIVGNETQQQHILPFDELINYLDLARKVLNIPVSTAEPAHIWHNKPELVNHVDFIALQILPYWEGKEVHAAVDYVFSELQALKAKYPHKPIIISEVGWPSHGRVRQQAVASVTNQATFLRHFLARVATERYIYYIMEAFDQPWKTDIEGAVGAYWGVYNAVRTPKFEFTQPVVPTPKWQLLAAISIVLAIITFSLLLIDSKTLRGHGRSFLALVSYFAATAIVWIIYEYTSLYLTMGTIIIGVLMVAGMFGIVIVLLAEAHEWAEALWLTGHRRSLNLEALPDDRLPMFSIHVPAYNEPPLMLIQTLDALARLDYPNYEVLVIDNNTSDASVWQPVKKHCEKLGGRFRFFHVDPLSGFKAGALNFALAHTSVEAEMVAVIDSDYVVSPRWLRDLAPQFSDPQVAIVQAPQDYSDGSNNAFKAMCYSEYAGFFYIGMITRNERNAIIQHGTMTMVRRRVLEEVGGWAEWCITEDAELGLRIFERGYEAYYIPHSYGRGLMPDSFIDYKKQRFRWAYGAVQILRHHAGELFSNRGSSLSLGQRYHFIAGWMPWFADGFNLLFNLVAIGWSLAMIVAPNYFDPPLVVFSLLPLSLFVFKLAKLFYIYKTRIGASIVQTILAAIAGLSLAHTISRAVLLGLVTSGMPFIRTPKLSDQQRWTRVIAVVREEVLLLVALWLAAGVLLERQGTDSPDMLLWIVVLFVQSLVYLSSLIVSAISSLPQLSARHIGIHQIDRPEYESLDEAGDVQ